jgi:hypothetical protein
MNTDDARSRGRQSFREAAAFTLAHAPSGVFFDDELRQAWQEGWAEAEASQEDVAARDATRTRNIAMLAQTPRPYGTLGYQDTLVEIVETTTQGGA